MMKKLLSLTIAVLIVLVSCAPKQLVTPAAAPAPAPAKAAVSDGSEDLTIDYQVNLAGSDTDNFFHWKGNVRYMAADDNFDAVSGASALGSTHLFMMYLYDVEGKETMTSGLRGLFLYGVNGANASAADKLEATKASDGTITIQSVHRGTAYKFTTDSKGVLSLPDGKMEARKIGTPQEIESAFSSDGKATGVDYAKVWASDVQKIGADPASMYFWDGDLQFALNGDMLTAKGVLTAVKR
ncbi:MAG: hypothetical protein JXA95_16960 [Spirochaetales bacterium]|nr:hypothetical protein [Spirochaetales bacterium]